MAKELPQNYKFRDLKIFGSTEWLANNEKKYRLVFDESECSFIYCELSFFNKLFDENDWDVRISLKCVNVEDGEEVCNLSAERKIGKEENIVFIREGWGVKKPGNYWKKGTYRWEAWIDGVFVSERLFYVIDLGLVSETVNPFFNITKVRLYEGSEANVPKADRKYFSVFGSDSTRYVWLEMEFENLINEAPLWPCELQFYFNTHTGQLKGSIDKLFFVETREKTFECSVGWGNEQKGTWGLDAYSISVLFMDQVIATIPFDVGVDFIEETRPEIPKAKVRETFKQTATNVSMDLVLKELDDLIGLDAIKKKVKEYTTYLNFLKIRKEKGFDDSEKINLHAVFTGNPGTGKTTVAKMLGRIYQQLGLLSKGHVLEVDRSDLVAEYIGQTAPKTKEIIKKAKGGILFIDEAYALARKNDDSKDFGKESIEILLKEMSDGDGDLAIIVAGYPTEMNGFLESNPGMKSRFSMFYEFVDYLPQELMQIANFTMEKRGVVLSTAASDYLYKKLVDAYRNRDKMFGNARYVNSIIDESKMNMGLRLMQTHNPADLTKEELSTIDSLDIEKIFEGKKKGIADIPIDEDLLKQAMSTLHSMIGLESVKNEIDELVKLVRFYREIGKDVRQSFSLHAVFTGNPGTGKTTVARILAQIYKALGILERGNLVECDRQGLVGGFVGQTALKTAEVLEKAQGGVLFIDEAYSLSEGGENDFGKEAIETILKKMEDNRGDFIVIVAGYTDNMKDFLQSNPGLSSRFDRELNFADYSAEQLYLIAIKMLQGNSIVPDVKAADHLKSYLAWLYANRNKYFGNARNVRKLIEEVIKNQHLRLAKLTAAERSSDMINTIYLEDVEEFKIENVSTNAKKSIGFNQNS
ncbi:MAG: AAA family ATPase [Bacteroidetes bacterium B1(2017)]|nr:MAG: AAA family ATPase [Bacteroidetes bacterium B1(2017)]